jgi:hypothetical protein
MTYEEAKMQIQAIPEKIWDQLSEPDREAMEMAFSALQAQDVPDINVGNCPYCHEDSDGFVFPIEKNGHACVWHDVDGWVISLKAKGWRGSCHIKFCPMCGRDLFVK